MVSTGLACYNGLWGNEKTKRERDTGPLLEETYDKQVNESGRLESVCLWRNYTSKKIPPKRGRLRTKGPVTRRTCRRDWMAKKTRPMAPGQKALRCPCAGNRAEQLTRTTWVRNAGPAGCDRERDATLSCHESLTGFLRRRGIPWLTFYKETILALPRGYTGPERGTVGLWMVPVSFSQWDLTTALIQAADDRWLN